MPAAAAMIALCKETPWLKTRRAFICVAYLLLTRSRTRLLALCSRVTPGPPELHFLFSPTRKSPRQGTPPPRHRRQQQREQGRNCGTTL
ncbi:uncharacterized [Tachysurus ichikawai]